MKFGGNRSRLLSFRRIKILNFAFSQKKLCYHEKKKSRFLCQNTQNDVKRPKKWFRKNLRTVGYFHFF